LSFFKASFSGAKRFLTAWGKTDTKSLSFGDGIIDWC